MTGDELELVDWLRERQQDRAAVRLGIGDDMAIVDVGGRRVLTSSDMLLDGVHFVTSSQELGLIGRKAIACLLSDCAAMAADPVAATVSLALPDDMEMAESKALIDGMAAMADEYDLAIVGGDTTRWARPLAIDVAVLARPYDGVEPVTRAGARVGDILYVTGPLGGSRLGRHLDFVPRVRESLELATRLGQRLHALIDLSDGLSLDLWRVCRASGVGATLDEALLERVISDDARRLAEQDGLTPIEHALQDGEDFELLAAVEGRVAVSGVTLHEIGHVTETGLWIRQVNGCTDPLEPKGFVH